MKPAHVWTAFGLCLAVVLTAMIGSTRLVLDVERRERLARAHAAREENTRLALWRMDSALTALVAEETSRPFLHYVASHPAAGRSPLAGRVPPPRILLHFQVSSSGVVSSPQGDPQRLAELRRLLPDTARLMAAARPLPPATMPDPPPMPLEKMKGTRELQARQESFRSNVLKLPARVAPPEGNALRPAWVGDALLLVRSVRMDGVTRVQGVWLDWPALEQELLTSVRDLLPAARLVRQEGDAPEDERLLVTLPVRLEPGELATPLAEGRSPVGLSLAAAWALFVVASASVAALLAGVLALSERRRVFVSAVTHELRTPLTTFQLYTDMLAEGMVEGAEKQQEYLAKLQAEARRLAHLVENVLFYARLDGGRAGGIREEVDLNGLADEWRERLDERARRAGLRLEIGTLAAGPLPVRVDRSALEQVVLNLVDNACRYAAGSAPPVIRLTTSRTRDTAFLHVRDHGPGLSRADRRRLFQPFSKSDREAANSAPGVGLGLALSRRLMRALDGDLRMDPDVTDGAGFVVSLPVA